MAGILKCGNYILSRMWLLMESVCKTREGSSFRPTLWNELNSFCCAALFVFASVLHPGEVSGQMKPDRITVTPWAGVPLATSGNMTGGVDFAVQVQDRIGLEFSVGLPFVAALGRFQVDRGGLFYLAGGPAAVWDSKWLAAGQVHGYAQPDLSDRLAARFGVRGIIPMERNTIEQAWIVTLGLAFRL